MGAGRAAVRPAGCYSVGRHRTPGLRHPGPIHAVPAPGAATKFIGGHSDVTAGVLAVRDKQLADRIYFVQVCAIQLSRDVPSYALCGKQALRHSVRFPAPAWLGQVSVLHLGPGQLRGCQAVLVDRAALLSCPVLPCPVLRHSQEREEMLPGGHYEPHLAAFTPPTPTPERSLSRSAHRTLRAPRWGPLIAGCSCAA